ncbi:Ion channel [Alteromonadaceae bacterium Bs31]|nr:Ion channel [Alteromonadaceae bacterium Bs31]
MNTQADSSEFRFIILLICLFGALLVPPYFESKPIFNLIWKVIFSGSLLAALYALGGKRSLLIPGLILLVPTLATVWVEEFSDSHLAYYLDNATTIAFLCFIVFHLGVYVLQARRVSTNVIYASLCVYLLIGFIWAAVYANIHLYFDGAFTFSNYPQLNNASPDNLMGYFVYYSFVTLSTLGYGDVTPVNHVAQSWSVVEAMIGQFFIAIVLARLVSMHAARAE